MQNLHITQSPQMVPLPVLDQRTKSAAPNSRVSKEADADWPGPETFCSHLRHTHIHLLGYLSMHLTYPPVNHR